MSEQKIERALPAVAGGVAWQMVGQIVAYGSRAAITIVLARLLSPTDFGVAGLALLFVLFVGVFTDLGSALIHFDDLEERDRTTAFWLSLAAGGALAAAGVAASGAIAQFFDEAAVQPLVVALSLSVIVNAAATVPSAILSRRLAFRQIELSNLTAVLMAAGTAFGVALLGGGAWAIVIQQIVHTVAYSGLLWLNARWYPTFTFSWQSGRRLIGYTWGVLGAKLSYFVEQNAGNILIGRFLGATSLGLYSLAYNLMLFPVLRLAQPVSTVLFPVLSRLQSDLKRMASIWLRATRFMAFVVAPITLLLTILASEFVNVVLGDKWLDVIPVVQVLAWSGLVHTLTIVSAPVLLAVGHTRQLFIYHTVAAITLIGGILIAVQFGIVEVAIAYAVSVTLLAPLYVVFTSRAVRARSRDFYRSLLGVVLASAGLVGVAIGMRQWMIQLGASDLSVLMGVIVLTLPVYGLLAWILNPGLADDLKALRRVVMRRRGSGVGEVQGGETTP